MQGLPLILVNKMMDEKNKNGKVGLGLGGLGVTDLKKPS
jgi:hypothetical protein